jgi:3-hydroxyacyl-[acyl-carrier-protein] dehydratase
MRWIWIDRFIKFEPGKSAQAVKNVSLAEEHLHDHFPGYPVMPASLIIEGVAQTAGVLICHASNFDDKVVLAKVSKVEFEGLALPGDVLLYSIEIEKINEQFAVAGGEVSIISPQSNKEKYQPRHLASMELMFSRLDHNPAGRKFPDDNFILTEAVSILLRDILPNGGKEPTDNSSG